MNFFQTLLIMLFCCSAQANVSIHVMAPLLVEDRPSFRLQLAEAKRLGVGGVSVDVWWGMVEAEADQVFDWRYYDDIFADISAAGLNIVPIMSFHQCGGNVGDNCNIPLPGWIWQHYINKGITQTDLQYKSEYGNYSAETVSLWADHVVIQQYSEFIQAFSQHFQHLSNRLAEINISMGPAGELRYPSYNSHDDGKSAYPTRGSFQAYSTLAVQDFRQAMQSKYGDIVKLNASWNTQHTDFKQVIPPLDGNQFINSGQHRHSQYGKDFIDWYHLSLIAHGNRMLEAADAALADTFNAVPLGYKIPGIHWKMAIDDYSARSAELAAGLLHSDWPYHEGNGYGYIHMVAVAKQLNSKQAGSSQPGHKQRQVILHFTALEMQDSPMPPSYSMAKTLVRWLGEEAKRQQVTIKGENALSAGVEHVSGWDNMQQALQNSHYSGLTILRLEQVTNNETGKQGLKTLIQTK